MSVIGPGTLLICVDASPNANGEPPPLTVGALYRCDRFTDYPGRQYCTRDRCGPQGINLVGVKAYGICPNRFKPFIDGLDEEIIEEEKEPTHDYV